MGVQGISIKTKLYVLVGVPAGVALLMSCITFVANDVTMIRSSKVAQLFALAEVLGFNSKTALLFDDPSTADELLASLHAQPTIEFACLFDDQGRLFSAYGPAHWWNDPPAMPARSGHHFTATGYLDVAQQVVHDGEVIGTILLRASMQDLYNQQVQYLRVAMVVMMVSLGTAFVLAARLQRIVSNPIVQLAETAQKISESGDYSVRVQKYADDELGTLYDEFNEMLDRIQLGERQLQAAHGQLEARVVERTQQLSKANLELSREVAERKRAETELEQAHQQLVAAARSAGMAEVANGVLHNVGNVLNSLNVSATLVTDWVKRSRIPDLARAVELIRQNEQNLGRYLTEDQRGRQLPGFLKLLAEHLQNERRAELEELQTLCEKIEHIKTIVSMQQSYAGVFGVVEPVALADLLDDALKLNSASFEKYGIEVRREYAELPEVCVEKQKLLQVLVNLVKNAKDSLIASDNPQRQLTLRIALSEGDDERVRIEVADNGEGIAEENMTRIFSHGFTTKRDGHGFGLHSCAIAAREMGGALTASSDGLGKGATFTVELPFRTAEVAV